MEDRDRLLMDSRNRTGRSFRKPPPTKMPEMSDEECRSFVAQLVAICANHNIRRIIQFDESG
jgi:hypothetical protein